MPKTTDFPKPLSKNTFGRTVKPRPAMRDNLAHISKSFFIAGAEREPRVEVKVIRVERKTDGATLRHYEVRLDVSGVRLGERSSPPGMRAKLVKERIPAQRLREYDHVLAGFVPDHLAIEPRPQRLLKAFRRIPLRMDKRKRYNTTIFDPDQRQVFQDTSYPWSAFGRCETNLGPFSGVMIGPRHLLTCNHGIDWTPPPGYDADWLTF